MRLKCPWLQRALILTARVLGLIGPGEFIKEEMWNSWGDTWASGNLNSHATPAGTHGPAATPLNNLVLLKCSI